MDPSSSAYRVLALAAISGELSPDALPLTGISKSYQEKLLTRLKEEGLLKTHYRDRLRGYRLTGKGKESLLAGNPERFSFYLTGNCDTNRPRSEYPRRLRLQQASLIYALLWQAGIPFFRDEKPRLFSPCQGRTAEGAVRLPLPVFYHSRELKELGAETVKIGNSRAMGILLTPGCIYALFYTGESLMKWEYRTELKVKALLSHHMSQGILSAGRISPAYHPDTPIRALLIGRGADTGLKLLGSTGGFRKSYFYLDTSFDYFHYIPDDPAGVSILRLLCSRRMQKALKELLLSDLQPPCSDYGLEHDALSDSFPVLLAYDFDMLRISRFRTALSLLGITGNLICFDFQKTALAQYFQGTASIETIDLKKFEGRFLH